MHHQNPANLVRRTRNDILRILALRVDRVYLVLDRLHVHPRPQELSKPISRGVDLLLHARL